MNWMRIAHTSRSLTGARGAMENTNRSGMTIGWGWLTIVVAIGFAALGPTNAVAHSARPPSCTSPEYHQFDFWLGDWDVIDRDTGKSTAHVQVDRILDGCALRERYEDTTGTVGESFSTYDVGRKLWHQTWVTNRGRLLTIEGNAGQGGMVLAGAYFRDNGEEVRVRGTWKPVPGGVQETAVTSDDAGKHWKPWFDLLFRPRNVKPPDASSAPDNGEHDFDFETGKLERLTSSACFYPLAGSSDWFECDG